MYTQKINLTFVQDCLIMISGSEIMDEEEER